MSLTADIDDKFFPRLEQIADELGADKLHLLKVWKSESDVRATAANDGPPGAPYAKQYHASGIFQAMPATLPGLGWTGGFAAFRQLTATEQLEYARRYYLPWKGKLPSVGAIYTATFLPSLTAHAGDPSFVLTAKDGPLGWAYAPNSVFDENGDFAITVGELEDAVTRNCVGARWSELASRCTGTLQVIADAADEYDVRTVMGIQKALVSLGFDPGKVDGLPGPRTTQAVASFQVSRGLGMDGIVGPLTRQALLAAVAADH